jgi:hypothetical protein
MEYRMTITPAFEAGNHSITFEFETAGQMLAAQNTAADLLLFLQNTAGVMDDYSNVFCLEEMIEGEWEEYDDLTAF